MPRRRVARWTRACGVAVAVVALVSCRVDATVDVTIDENGAGTIEVTVVTDAEVVQDAPDLAEDLRSDDIAAAGWTTDGPQPTESGGLQIVLTHEFSTPEEATALLDQLSGPDGPFVDLEIVQTRSFARVDTGVDGSILLANGTATFADADVVGLVGGDPYLTTLQERGIPLEDALGLRLAVTAPGDLVETDGEATPPVDGTATVTWTADIVGEAASAPGQTVSMQTALVDDEARRASRIEDFAPWALAAWVVLIVGVVIPVVALFRRRRRRRPT